MTLSSFRITRMLAIARSALSRDNGAALPVAIGFVMLLTVIGISVIGFTSSNTRSSEISKDRQAAAALAESGVNLALAVLSKKNPDDTYTHNLLDPNLLPATTESIPGESGSVTWSGTLDTSGPWPEWIITARGSIHNPTGGDASDLSRDAAARVLVLTSGGSVPQQVPWDYVYTTATGSVCDVVIQNSTEWGSPLYVAGNLCLENSASITGGALNVHGNLVQSQSGNTIGTSVLPIASAQIGGSCQWTSNPAHAPCLNGDGAAGFDQIHASSLAAGAPVPNSPTVETVPAIDFSAWYGAASPGPGFACISSSGAPPNGTASWATAFDIDGIKNRNNPGFNLTPDWDYSCTTATGELSWDLATARLTVGGAIYIDGDVVAEPTSGINMDYNGVGAIFMSGTFSLKGSQLCATRIDASGCNWGTTAPAWDTSTKMLLLAADGVIGPSPMKPDVSVFLRSTQFQGALYSSGKIEFDTTTQLQAAMVGTPVLTGNSVITHPFTGPMLVPGGPPVTSPTSTALGTPNVYLD